MSEEEDKKKEEEKKKKEEEEKKKKEAEDEFKQKNIENIPQIIATISPFYYAAPACISKVQKLKKEGKFWEAVNAAKPGTGIVGRDTKGLELKISYNSSAEGLEPIYFWLVDFIESIGYANPEKIVDNFVSSPGSGHFSELMGKATRMQEESMKIMQTIGVLIKSIINIIYDLRQFEIRLQDYGAANSSNKEKAEAGLLALKQVWMDNVDIKRGNTSIKAMAFSQAAFATLIDAFMMTKSLADLSKSAEQGGLDLNERVKNILKQRFSEFENWKRLSESELKKRFNMEKAWLKSQVDSLKLYSRWAKPYLKAAEELKMNTGTLSNSAALVKAFNTNIMQLTLLAKQEIKIEDSVFNKALPRGFEKLDDKKAVRKYSACLIVDFKFRGIPQRVDQHYAFGGKADVSIRAYALNDQELVELKKRLEESDLKEAMKLAEGATEDSLKEIQEDIDYFLKDEEDRVEDKVEAEEEKKPEDINPFTALIGKGIFWDKEKKKPEEQKVIMGDNYAEKLIRFLAEITARKSCFTVYDIYKKAHGMAAVPLGDYFEQGRVSVGFKDLFKK